MILLVLCFTSADRWPAVVCREWHSERTKLIHCVHIQQMELMQRAAASHERAADIAKV